MANENVNKEYKDERFDFLLYVNDFLICKRTFKINNFIEGSMSTPNFKEVVDDIVRSIDNDLKSKSRVYTWYYYNEDDVLDEFESPLLEPWESTFKFEITDNKRTVFSKIWDGYGYPKSIRDKVDITNKIVKIVTKDGRTYVYDKETYFNENADRLTPEMYVLRAMIMDKQDLPTAIIKKICENCSPRESLYKNIGDYTNSEVFETTDFERNEDGSVKIDENGNKHIRVVKGASKRYLYSIDQINKKYISDWSKAVSSKTKKYFETLY